MLKTRSFIFSAPVWQFPRYWLARLVGEGGEGYNMFPPRKSNDDDYGMFFNGSFTVESA